MKIKTFIIIVSSILTSIGIIMSILKLSDTKSNLKTILCGIFLLFPMLVIGYIYFNGVSKIILTVLAISMSLYFSILDKNIQKSIFYSLIYEFLASIIEILICLIEIVVFKFDVSNFDSSPKFILITTIINLLVVYGICNIKKFKNIVHKIDNVVHNNIKSWIFISFSTILLIFLVASNGYNFKNNIHFYINISMTVFIVATLLVIIQNTLKRRNIEIKYNVMMEYVCKYEKIINDQGKKNHEYNNQLMVIKGYINNPKKLEEYLSLIIEEHKCGQNYTIKQLSYFPDGGIKGLIYDKLSKMEENQIKNYLYIDKKAKDIFEDKFDIKTYQDITKLLGIFLDNAIDATLQAKNKEIELEIKNDVDCSIITISNTYNESIDIKQIGKKGFSTKGSGHGYGLSIVKDISRCNKNIETFNDIDNKKFKQTIIAYYCK